MGQNARVMAHANNMATDLVILVLGRRAQTANDLQTAIAQLLHLYQRQMVANAGLQNGRVKGFGDVVYCPHVQPHLFIMWLRERSDKNNRDMARFQFGPQGPTDLVARHLRHHDVQQYQIRQITLGQFQCLDSVLGKQQPVILLQRVAQNLKVGRLVIDQQ